LRQGLATNLLTPLAAAAGIACVAPRFFGLIEPGGSFDTIGVALLMSSAGGGLLLRRLYNVGCERLARSTELAVRAGELRPVSWPDDQLSPLVSALNECMTMAESAVSDAEGEVRRLAVELRLVMAQRQQAQAVIGSIEDAVLVTDPFDELLMANEAAGRLFGFEAAAAERRPVEQIIADPQVVSLIREMRESRSMSRRVVEHEMQAGDRRRHFRMTMACLRDDPAVTESDRSAGVVAVLRDATREHEAAQAKNDFVSSVTHELRTPLSSIRAYVEMLVDGDAQDEKTRREFYEIIQGETQRLSALIDNILSISRIESGLVKVDRKPASPMLIAERALEVILPQARSKNIEIRKELLPALFQVTADHELLYQVILNLLSNAVKYTPEGGTVTVRTEVDEPRRMLILKVIDNGAGIPEADQPRLFEKFYRVERNSGMAKGSGLGLPLVKRVIEQDHGGRVFVSSVEGKGSTFGFELPMIERRSE
jgi:two-component system phosphate regulon sensor histidine kinase PhoR